MSARYSWKSPDTLSRVTLLCVGLSMALQIVLTTVLLLMPPFEPGDLVGTLKFGMAMAAVGLLGCVLYVPGFLWLWRVSANAHAISAGMKHSPAAAVFWFFVPLANFVLPYVVLREVWSTTSADTSPNVLNVWWGLFVCTCTISLGNSIAGAAGFSAPAMVWILQAGNVAYAIGFAVVVRKLTAMQLRMTTASVF